MPLRPLSLGPIRKARFIARPNRFLVRCRAEARGVVEAFLPNPGRLWELLLPGAVLYLTSQLGGGGAPARRRKTRYTVLAVERDGMPIFLHTHLTNHVVRFLIEQRKIPPLADAEVLRAEVPAGNRRFDFLLRQGGSDVYLEVKSCTLYGNEVAMFPDAVTERGRRHLVELAALARRGPRPYVLFLAHTSRVRWFMPDYHTDLAFSRTLLNVRKQLHVLPVAIQWNRDLTLAPQIKMLEMPWRYLRREVNDRGSYLLVLRLEGPKRVDIGRLGTVAFRSGYYVYVGSAMGHLSARIARHRRSRKNLRWHVDYLRRQADRFVVLPIRSSRRRECEIARACSELFSGGPKGFGCSDCRCLTHLFWHAADPLQCAGFHGLLQRFRMTPPASGGRRKKQFSSVRCL